MKRILLASALAMGATLSQAQRMITPSMLASMQQMEQTAADKALRNAISANPISKMAVNMEQSADVDTYFSIDIKNTGVTNQESSGRCWLFTGTNVLRHKAMKKLGITGFMFSHNYLFFYDQLEKSNLFLQGIIDTHKEGRHTTPRSRGLKA